jgi:SNF2 family DNA or RNA helicase
MRRGGRRVPLPLIDPKAVQAYLHRPLDNHDWVKDVPKDELRKYIGRDLGAVLANDLWPQQLACFALGARYDGFLFALDMGGGKSATTLELLRYRKQRGELQRGIILAPEIVHIAGWEENLRLHAPDLTYRLLLGDSDDKARQLQRPSDVVVMTYKGLEGFMSRRLKVPGKKGREEYKMDPKAASEFAVQFNFLAMDEMHKLLSSRDSLKFELCRWLSLNADYRYGLTGTPFGRDPLPLWSIMYLLDHGATFGERISLFRHSFYRARKSWFAGIEWKFRKETMTSLRRVLKHRSITYKASEFADMPPLIPIRFRVDMAPEQAAYYKRIVRGLAEARGDYRSLQNVFVRMRQCASGYISMKADDESRIQVRFKENPKLERLREFLKSRDEKLLVFHEFRVTGDLLSQLLEEMKLKFALLRGGMGDKGMAEYRRFLKEDSCRVFLLNNALGSEAINPQYVSRRALFFESPPDPRQRTQAERRVWRPGQAYTTFLHDLLVRGTVEEKIYRYNREGRDLLAEVFKLGEEAVLEDEPKK